MKQTLTAYTTGPWRVEGNEFAAPVTMMTEGVHHGSSGPIFWAGHVLRANAHKWANVPVSLDHPTINGRPVSINHNDIVKQQHTLGRVVNPYYDPAKKALRGEVRIPANQARQHNVQGIKEVSVGVFSDETYESGEFNGKHYIACSIAMEPDHLALLPNEKGACSWEDGCGIRANSKAREALQNAVATYMKTLNGGQQIMSNEKLLPPGVHEEKQADLDTLQAKADQNDVLLPTEYNRSSKPTKQQDSEEEPLLPTGLN